MQIETEKILLDILQKEMDLSDSQVWVYNQDFVMPKTSGLFIIAGMQYDKIISNNSNFQEVTNDTGGSDTVEVQNINAVEYIKISLMSKNTEARQRKNEVLHAMASYFSEQMQQKYSLKIAKIPNSFNNVSDAEGSTTINRFDIIVPVHVWYEKIKEISTGYGSDYYESFDNNVIIDTTSGEIFYTINSTSGIAIEEN